MKTIRFPALMATTGGLLVMLAIGPALASHGFSMTGHPLRGDLPVAGPAAAEPEPEAAAIATAGLAETWTCSLDRTTAQAADSGTPRAVMRIIHLKQ